MRLMKRTIRSWGPLGLSVLLVVGCGPANQDPPYGEGKDGVPDIVGDESDYDTFWMARAEVTEINQLTGKDPGHNTLVSAYFTDFTHYRVVLANTLPFSEACHIITSMPSEVKFCRPEGTCSEESGCQEGWSCLEGICTPNPTACEEDEQCPGILVCDQNICTWPACSPGSCDESYTCLPGARSPLYVDQVVFRGLVGGDLELSPSSPGRFQRVLEGRAFEQEQVSLQVLAEDTPRSFPAFEEQIQAPEAPIVTRLDDEMHPDLATDISLKISLERVDPLIVEWQPKEADYIELKIIPGSGSKTPYVKLRCITFDDGGLEVPVEALRYLSLDEATNFQFKLERHYFVEHPIKEDESVKAMALLDTGSVLEATVVK